MTNVFKMTKVKSLILSGILISFNVTPYEVNHKYEKVIDNDLRKHYYSKCKQAKQDACHMKAFESAVKLRIVNAK